MINLSEKIADSYRKGVTPKANPGNPVTSRRRKLYETIKERTGGDPDGEYDYALKIIAQERPKIENYVISKNETPMDSIEDLIMQAYQLRCNEIDSTANILGVSEGEAGIFLEDDEAETEMANNPEQDNFIGELFAPVGIAAGHIRKQSNNFVDPAMVSGIVNTIGAKLDAGALKRAAANKPAGIVGALTGGAKEYNALRAYLQDPKNVKEKDAVLRGTITDVSQLAGYGTTVPAGGGGIQAPKILGVDVLKAIEDQKKKETIQKALPFIIIGVIVIILVTFLIARRAKSK